MKEKTADKIAAALEEMLDVNRMSATEILGAMLGTPIARKYKKIVRTGYRAGLKQGLKEMTEPSKDKLIEILTMIEALKGARYKMRRFLKQAIKELPYAPGGPPKKVKLQEEAIVCAEILALRAELDTREAIRRVARKRGASERTIYRVWGKYYPKKRKTLPVPKTGEKA